MIPARPVLPPATRRRLVEVARRREAPDLAVTGGVVANVYSGEWLRWNVEVADGRIAYCGPRKPAIDSGTLVVDAAGRVVAPGYVEAHFHPWALYNPRTVLEVALPRGTTALVADNLPFFLQFGVVGFRRVIDALASQPVHLYWVARVVSQSRFPGEEKLFTTDAVREQLTWPEVVGTAEITRWVDLADGDPHMLASLAAAKEFGKRSDGHTAGASFDRLAATVAAGLSADHEAITAEEALARLRLGLWTMVRHSSLRRDLPEILGGLLDAGVDTSRLILTTDGSGPSHYRECGLLDELLHAAVEAGVEPMQALQMATRNPATFLGLDEEIGGLAPGRRATFQLLPDASTFVPELVVVGGRTVACDGRLVVDLPPVDWDALGARPIFADPDGFVNPSLYMLRGEGAARTVPVMSYESAVIARREDRVLPVREGFVDLTEERDCVYAALLDRRRTRIARGIVAGLFPGLRGLASSYNTAGQLLVLGRDPRAMAAAAREVAALGGGIAFAEGERIVWSAELDVVGFATSAPFETAVRIEEELRARAAAAGYPFHDPLYTLLFLVCDFLPDLRLTLDGLIEVKSGAVLELGESLA